MDVRKIKNLMKEFELSNIHKLEITDLDFSIKLEKEQKQYVTNSLKETPQFQLEQKEELTSITQETNIHCDHIIVKAPLVGTYYESSSPDSAPFVRVNDNVKKGDTLCIIEAMKVMNEITAPVDGRIKSINVINNDMVEYGQIIMEIEE